MKNAIKRMILASGAVVLSAWLGVGCSAESMPDATGDVTVEKQADGRYLLRLANAPDEATQSPDGTPGESVDGETDKGAANCVYVQWCNEPGPSGTICRLRSGCSYNNATVNECIRDTNYVCGAPVHPWYLF
jgi:hypothetical protein